MKTPRAERTSDVTRFHGVALAALAASLVVAIAAVWSARDPSAAPGPLSAPHRQAGVSCDSCHGAPELVTACVGCHQAHPSTRPAHRALAASGKLTCAGCHPAHRDHATVTFAPDGVARRDGQVVDGGGFRPLASITVPLIRVTAACVRCHAPHAPDPIAACLVPGSDVTVCFDEHRAVRDAAGVLTPRGPAWEAARQVAAIAPPPIARPAKRRAAPWSWIALGGLAGLVGFGGVRGVDRLRRRRAPKAVAPPISELRRLPVIDAATCLGCYACVDACPFDVLEIRRYVAVVARPKDCCGLTLCEQRCPNRALVMSDHAAAAPARSHIAGLYLAGDVTGQPLIRNAIDQGTRAVVEIAARLATAPPRPADTLDLVIVGAGPAGLAAALEATARGLRSLALEQATVVENIRSFPRGKLVIDGDAPSPGRLWLAEATKEELLARWTRTVRQERPTILEGRRVTAIERHDGGFVVRDVDRDGATSEHRAAHVLVAVGRRGTARTLSIEIPPAVADHVHYSLADARSFAGRRVLVVGLGDVAMEAAIALSRQPGTEVVVSYRGADFQRGKARNIAEVRRRAAAGALRLVWESEVRALAPGRATLTTPAGPVEVACDSVVVLIGSIPPEALLRQIGVTAQIDSEDRAFDRVATVASPSLPEENP